MKPNEELLEIVAGTSPGATQENCAAVERSRECVVTQLSDSMPRQNRPGGTNGCGCVRLVPRNRVVKIGHGPLVGIIEQRKAKAATSNQAANNHHGDHDDSAERIPLSHSAVPPLPV